MHSVVWQRIRGRLLRLVATIGVGILLVGVPVSAANADATAGHNAVHFTLTCAGEKFAVVSPSEPAAAVQIVGISSVLVGTDALLTTTYTDPQTGQLVTNTQHIVYGAGHGSANGTQDRAIHCADTTVVNDPDVGPITITLLATFLLAPPH
jgi:hypothetical protein